MMLKKVYIETTVISYLTARPSRQESMRLDQEATKQWWAGCRESCEVFGSNLVYDEAKRGDTKAAQERLEILKSLPLLQADAASKKLPRKFVKQGAIPETEKADALHIAIATTFGMDYLVTWNLRHIKNRVKRVEIDAICRHEGYEPPTFYSPRELLEIKHVEPNPG